MIWLEDCLDKKIPVNGNIIRQKALKFFDHLKNSENFSQETLNQLSFKASDGWFSRLKKRYTLHNIKFQGEQASANTEAAGIFKVDLEKIISEGNYMPEQIFNADETALNWKKLPSRTFTIKNQRQAKGYKLSKNRVTFHMCCNLSGSKMIKPMIINYSNNPRSMKGVDKSKLPVFWRASRKAWMTKLFLMSG